MQSRVGWGLTLLGYVWMCPPRWGTFSHLLVYQWVPFFTLWYSYGSLIFTSSIPFGGSLIHSTIFMGTRICPVNIAETVIIFLIRKCKIIIIFAKNINYHFKKHPYTALSLFLDYNQSAHCQQEHCI